MAAKIPQHYYNKISHASSSSLLIYIHITSITIISPIAISHFTLPQQHFKMRSTSTLSQNHVTHVILKYIIYHHNSSTLIYQTTKQNSNSHFMICYSGHIESSFVYTGFRCQFQDASLVKFLIHQFYDIVAPAMHL